MTKVIGYNGILARHTESDRIEIELDYETYALVQYFKDLQRAMLSESVTNGYDFAHLISSMLTDIEDTKHRLEREEQYRTNNPAVQSAWEHYQTMLGLATQEDQNFET